MCSLCGRRTPGPVGLGGEPAGTWPQPRPALGVLVPAARSTVPRESRQGGLSVLRAEDTPDALPPEVL